VPVRMDVSVGVHTVGGVILQRAKIELLVNHHKRNFISSMFVQPVLVMMITGQVYVKQKPLSTGAWISDEGVLKSLNLCQPMCASNRE
jgi:hypothetical protein